MNHPFAKTLRRTTLALAMGLLAVPAQQAWSAIFWPGGGVGGNDKEADFQEGYDDGRQDCRTTPLDCGVEIERMVRDQGYGETEPNDHLYNADGLLPGLFHHANSRGQYDGDWYYVTSDRENQKLSIHFLGDPGNYGDTAGWVIRVHDRKGNLIAAFDSAPRGSSTAPQPTEGESGQISPVDQARITEVTLGKVGTYYISVESKEENGANRGYHIAVTLKNTGQVSADHGNAPFDTETEPNDTRQQADVLRPNVAMAGVFDRTLIGPYTEVITPAVTDIGYFYVGCNESDPTTLPSGNTDCQCDMSQVSPGGNAYVEPGNPNITNPPPTDCAADVDSANPDNACKRETACEARVVTTTPEQTQYVGRFHYDTEVFVYRSDGDEQVRIQICTRTQCEFERVHLKVHQGNVLLMEGPIQPGQVIDLGVAFPGDYYFILSPEPNGVDPETGDPILDDLFGPYDILLMSTRLRPSGPTPEPKPVQEPEKENPPKQDDKKEEPPEQQEKSWLEMFLGG